VKNAAIYFLFIVFLLAGCDARYSYLSKVKGIPKKGSIKVEITNKSGSLLDAQFENDLGEYIYNRLKKEGFHVTEKNPKYLLKVEMEVDSSLNHGIAFAGPGPGYYAYSRMSKGIDLQMETRQISSNFLVWEDRYNLYFFNDKKRDLKRCKGVVRYMLSGFKP
jgi:hypothetical protein